MERQWPIINYDKGKSSYETLHLWTQIIGKIKMASLPWINHSWHVALYISPTGLTTMSLPYKDLNFQIDFDFTKHQLRLSTSNGDLRHFDLHGLSVADFYQKTMAMLKELKIGLHISTIPSEIENPIPFEQDVIHATYDVEVVIAFHQALLITQDVFVQFRSNFKGKCSPIHLYWGSFDVAFSLFSGLPAPKHPGGISGLPDWVAQEAYSHELCSCGFWPGNDMVPEAAFYSYCYPEPVGYKTAAIKPSEAYYHQTLGEYILPYAAVQKSPYPKHTLFEFLDSCFREGATLSNWDKRLL